jgi:hypothetical protein
MDYILVAFLGPPAVFSFSWSLWNPMLYMEGTAKVCTMWIKVGIDWAPTCTHTYIYYLQLQLALNKWLDWKLVMYVIPSHLHAIEGTVSPGRSFTVGRLVAYVCAPTGVALKPLAMITSQLLLCAVDARARANQRKTCRTKLISPSTLLHYFLVNLGWIHTHTHISPMTMDTWDNMGRVLPRYHC